MLLKIKVDRVLEAAAIKFFLVAIGNLFMLIVAPVGTYTNQKPTIKIRIWGKVFKKHREIIAADKARIEFRLTW